MFCDQVGPRAEEDIISRWVSKELEPVGPISTDFLTEVPDQPIVRHTKQFGSLATLKLPRTCADCNGGWMSRLEALFSTCLPTPGWGRVEGYDRAMKVPAKGLEH